jgi:hypothetical protein
MVVPEPEGAGSAKSRWQGSMPARQTTDIRTGPALAAGMGTLG